MKKLFIIVCCLISICFLVTNVFAVGTCIYLGAQTLEGHVKHKWKVTTDANGDMTETGTDCTSPAIVGWLVQVEFWPDSSSPWTDTTADIELRGTNTNPAFNTDYDYCHGTGADLDSSITDSDNIRSPLTSDGAYIWLHGIKLTPWLDEAGNAMTGEVYAIVKTKKD